MCRLYAWEAAGQKGGAKSVGGARQVLDIVFKCLLV